MQVGAADLSRHAVIVLFVNIFASTTYWGRMIANAYCSNGFLMLTRYRYCDYLVSCPLLVLDLLWNLEAPYKWYGSNQRTLVLLQTAHSCVSGNNVLLCFCCCCCCSFCGCCCCSFCGCHCSSFSGCPAAAN